MTAPQSLQAQRFGRTWFASRAKKIPTSAALDADDSSARPPTSSHNERYAASTTASGMPQGRPTPDAPTQALCPPTSHRGHHHARRDHHQAHHTTRTTPTRLLYASPYPPLLTTLPQPTNPHLPLVKLNDRKTKTLRSAFAVYPTTTAAGTQTEAPPPVNALQALHEAQIKKMDPTGARTALVARNREAAQPGDVLMVTHRRGGEPFAGVCLSIRRRGIDTGVLLRNHLTKVAVEMWFKVYNKNVAGIEVIKRRAKRARRARLTYMRKPKHDMGSVEDLVFAWKRSRKVFSTGKPVVAAVGKGKGKKAAAAGGKKK